MTPLRCCGVDESFDSSGKGCGVSPLQMSRLTLSISPAHYNMKGTG
jgi:hypothetical protein